MKILPHDYYSMSIDDAALMFKGWYEQQEQEFLRLDWVTRKQTIYLADTINKSAGGKGADKAIKKAWEHPWDKQKTSSELKDKLALRKQQSKQYNNGKRID